MPKFQVGDIIIGNSSNTYSITANNVSCVVVGVINSEGEVTHSLVGDDLSYLPELEYQSDDLLVTVVGDDSVYDVASEHFDLVLPVNRNMEIGIS